MACPHTAKPASGDCAERVSKDVHAWRLNSPDNTDPTAKEQDALPLIGANGRRYSEAILRHWSPAAIRALGILRADGGAS